MIHVTRLPRGAPLRYRATYETSDGAFMVACGETAEEARGALVTRALDFLAEEGIQHEFCPECGEGLRHDADLCSARCQLLAMLDGENDRPWPFYASESIQNHHEQTGEP